MSDDASKLQVLARVLDGFNRHDVAAIMEEFSDDCVFVSPRGPDPCGRRLEGRSAVSEGFAARFQGIPDVRYEGRGDFVAGERGVSEWTLTGTTTEGRRLEVWGCDLWTFDGDRITCKNSFWKIVEP
jgi:ketosteroid isomerase-like protein